MPKRLKTTKKIPDRVMLMFQWANPLAGKPQGLAWGTAPVGSDFIILKVFPLLANLVPKVPEFCPLLPRNPRTNQKTPVPQKSKFRMVIRTDLSLGYLS